MVCLKAGQVRRGAATYRTPETALLAQAMLTLESQDSTSPRFDPLTGRVYATTKIISPNEVLTRSIRPFSYILIASLLEAPHDRNPFPEKKLYIF